MDAKALPKTLYKYRSWDDKNDRRMLWHNEIYFASPSELNDPHDCRIRLRYDLMPVAEQIDLVVQHLNAIEPGLDEEEHRRRAENMVRTGFFTNLDWSSWERETEREMGVFSLTGLRNQTQMWSYYANSHRGLCVGLDVLAMKRFLDDLYAGDHVFVYDLFEVGYLHEYPELIPNGESHERDFRYQMTKKAGTWKHECEYRYIMQDVSDRVVHLPSDVITEVILGCWMSKADRQEIINVLKMRASKLRLFQAKPKKDDFGLDIDPVDY
jgi:hypothetical protein